MPESYHSRIGIPRLGAYQLHALLYQVQTICRSVARSDRYGFFMLSGRCLANSIDIVLPETSTTFGFAFQQITL